MAATSSATASSTSVATRTASPARVASIEYDPNRSARIALLNYADGERRYIVAPDGLKVGEQVQSGPDAEISRAIACRSRTFRSAPTSTTSS